VSVTMENAWGLHACIEGNTCESSEKTTGSERAKTSASLSSVSSHVGICAASVRVLVSLCYTRAGIFIFLCMHFFLSACRCRSLILPLLLAQVRWNGTVFKCVRVTPSLPPSLPPWQAGCLTD
jgi:hypothetical protein